MLWNLTSLWSFSSTAWHLFKVQTEPFCFPDPILSSPPEPPLPFPSEPHPFSPAPAGHQSDATSGLPSSPSAGMGGPARPAEPPARVPARPEEPFWRRARGRRSARCCGGRVLTNPAPLSRKARRLSISPRLWQGPGRRSNPCVRADEPHYPMKYFIITTAVKYWWLLASAECFSRRLSLRVMEPNSSLYTVSDIWKLPKKKQRSLE